MMEAIGFTACFVVAVTLIVTIICTCVMTCDNKNSINRLWDENKKLKDRVFDLKNKPARKINK